MLVQVPFVRNRPFVQVPFLKKKGKGTKGNVNYVPQSKKKTKIKRKTNKLTFVRSGTVRSESSVRPGAVSKCFLKEFFFKKKIKKKKID